MRTTDSRDGVSPAPCPYCGSKLDAATDPYGDARPKPGDASVCWYCAGVLVFGDDLAVRLPTDEERATFLLDPRYVAVAGGVMLRRVEEEQ